MIIKTKGARELAKALDGDAKKIRQQTKIAINYTAKWTKKQMAKQVQQELNVKQKDLTKRRIFEVKREATTKKLSAVVELKHTARLPLKDFGPKQNKRGTAYRVSKNSGRTTAQSAFMGPRPGQPAMKLGGHVFKRQGKARTPLIKLHGASPWGSYQVNNMRPMTVSETEKRLEIEIGKRVRTVLRRKQGKF